jgi:FtsP/CotA-like multicopper oxidase with cupredoxin domain
VTLSPRKIPQFVQPLDVPDLTAAGASGSRWHWDSFRYSARYSPTSAQINVSICEFQTQILPTRTIQKGVTTGTWAWGYQLGSGCTNPPLGRSYLGPVVIASRGTPTSMTFFNKLPNADVAKVKAYSRSADQTLIWGDPLSFNSATGGTRISGTAPWSGSPLPETNECWKAVQAALPLPPKCNQSYGKKISSPVPAAVHIHGGEVPAGLDGGPDSWWTKNGIHGHGYYSKGGTADAAAGKAVYVYPNGQEAAPIWFHDHMLGATRLNVYAGIAGGYVVTEPAGAYAAGLHPLGLSDASTGTLTEPTVPLIIQDRMFDTAGQLFFPNIGINLEHPFWVPEFVGDVIVVNGKAWPFHNVQPKRYRFIFLNGSNARAYELFLVNKTNGMAGPSLWVIGNDQGLLDIPQEANPHLAMMPGERYEVIIDFSGFGGQVIEMQNTAATPYTAGVPVNPTTTGRIMRFNVAAPATRPWTQRITLLLTGPLARTGMRWSVWPIRTRAPRA